MNDGKRDGEVTVRIQLPYLTDGSYCALDACDAMVAQGEDLVDLGADLELAVQTTYGPSANHLSS
jgi:hypothetical protein